MKKVVFSLMAIAGIVFTSCSSDDDENTCASCSLNVLGTTVVTEACDNGDGTVRLTVNGETQTLSGDDLEGVSPAEYVQALQDGCP